MKVNELRPREGETQEHGHQASFELYAGLFPYSPTWEVCRPLLMSSDSSACLPYPGSSSVR